MEMDSGAHFQKGMCLFGGGGGDGVLKEYKDLLIQSRFLFVFFILLY